MQIAMIAAVADNLAIGKGNDMPWHIPEDLKFFKRTTLGCPVIMGSNTFRSIGGRPLPGRTNIVVSRSMPSPETAGVTHAATLEEAFRLAAEVRDTHGEAPSRSFVIGGGLVYRQAMEHADILFITHVHTEISDAETFFPKIDPDIWSCVSRSETVTDPESGLRFEFAEYRRTDRKAGQRL